MRKKPEIRYPFLPKSTRYLLPGHFWQIPLSNGKFACGIVLQLAYQERYGQRTCFYAGLLDWCGDLLPNTESIVNAKILEQGSVHLKTIVRSGGQILGHRPLEIGNLEPLLERSQVHPRGARLVQGFNDLREATEEEKKTLEVRSGWGMDVIKIKAEQYFVRQIRPKKKYLSTAIEDV